MSAHKAIEGIYEFLPKSNFDPVLKTIITDQYIPDIMRADKFLIPRGCGVSQHLKDNIKRKTDVFVQCADLRLPYQLCWIEVAVPLADSVGGGFVQTGFLATQKPDRPYIIASYCIKDLESNMWVPPSTLLCIKLTGKFTFQEMPKLAMDDRVPTLNGELNMGNILCVDMKDQGIVDMDDEMDIGALSYLNSVLSIMNSRNVVNITNAPSAKLNRKRSNKGKVPVYKYYTLGIDLGTINKRKGDNSVNTRKGIMPLHKVIGKWHHYTKEKPMFGNPKLYGPFWKPAHTRGNRKNGVRMKDYCVQSAVI